MDYATEQGIASQDAGNILVVDYSQSGNSILAMQKFIEQRGDIPEDRIMYHSLNNDIFELEKNGPLRGLDEKIHTTLTLNLACMGLKEDCGNSYRMPYSYYDNAIEKGQITQDMLLDATRNNIESFSTPHARAWQICSLHEAMQLVSK